MWLGRRAKFGADQRHHRAQTRGGGDSATERRTGGARGEAHRGTGGGEQGTGSFLLLGVARFTLAVARGGWFFASRAGGLRKQLPEEGRRYLQTIRDGAQRMGVLIDDLLTFSRLSRLPLHKQTVNMTRLARDAFEELNGQRNGRKIDLRIGDLPSCEGDPALLKQVWMNLLSNAIKYTRKREAAVIDVGSRLEKGENVYFVRDNGTGFDMQYAHKLFGVFQRLHRADEFEGTGVGLAIVQRVVHRHGGRIWAEAAVDRGATFHFTLEGAKNV